MIRFRLIVIFLLILSSTPVAIAQSWVEKYNQGLQLFSSRETNKFTKSYELFLSAQKEAKSQEQECSFQYVNLLTSLTTASSFIGSPSNEIEHISEWEECILKSAGDRSLGYAVLLDTKAQWLSRYNNNNKEAERLLKKALSIKLTQNNLQSAKITIHILANLYSNTERFEEAIRLYNFLKSYAKRNGLDLSKTRIYDDYIAEAYYNNGNYQEAIAVYEEIIPLLNDKWLTPRRLTNLANIFLELGIMNGNDDKVRDAVALLKKAISVAGFDNYSDNSLAFALISLSIANVYLGNVEQGLEIFEKAINETEKRFGFFNDRRVGWTTKFGLALLDNDFVNRGEIILGQGLEYNSKLISNNFRYLSFDEKQKYYFENLKPGLEAYALCVLSNPQTDNVKRLVEYNMKYKGLLMNDEARIRNQIFESDEDSIISQYQRLTGLREKYALSKTLIPYQTDYVNELKAKMDKIERVLSDYSEPLELEAIPLSDVQKKLDENEIIVDILRVRKYDNYSWRNESEYIILKIPPSGKQIQFISAAYEEREESTLLNKYRRYIRFGDYTKETYDELWKPIEMDPSVNKIFLLADGIYHSVNLSTLLDNETNTYVAEKHQIINITSNKSLFLSEKNSSYSTVDIYGFPKYRIDRDTVDSLTGMSPESDTLKRYLSFDKISELPGTRKELESLSQLYSERNANTYLGVKASEAILKKRKSPDILHIATHGFFLPIRNKRSNRYTNFQNPLLRSGILLSNAENFFQDQTLLDSQDGILTAYEAHNLNLFNTSLVVLSACETGLGEVKNGEGVYGLQRAFKSAGADYIVNSLWKVDDEATSFFMVEFHKELIQTGTIPEAFQSAVKKTKTRYIKPQLWGAFLLTN